MSPVATSSAAKARKAPRYAVKCSYCVRKTAKYSSNTNISSSCGLESSASAAVGTSVGPVKATTFFQRQFQQMIVDLEMKLNKKDKDVRLKFALNGLNNQQS